MERPYLSVVVPAYRKANTICDDIKSLHSFLQQFVSSHEIILVIDGNEDETQEKVHPCLEDCEELKVVCLKTNQGKGAAIHCGFGKSRGKYIAFMDAGGDLQCEDLAGLYQRLLAKNADIAVGSKMHPDSKVSYPFIRRVYSKAYQRVVRNLFSIDVSDTQVGMKMFKKEVVEAILPRLLIKRFAFDLELLVVARRLGYRKVVEAPISIDFDFSSTINKRAVMQTLWDTLAIFYRLHFIGWYDRESQVFSEKQQKKI